jgi:hypothetical protein
MIADKEKPTFRLYATVKMNRPVLESDYISPGGYTFVMNGEEITFDFSESYVSVSKDDKTVIQIMQKNPEYEYEGTDRITRAHVEQVEEIRDFFVYTGEHGETDLYPVELLECAFVLPYEKFLNLPVRSEVLKGAAFGCDIEADLEKETL